MKTIPIYSPNPWKNQTTPCNNEIAVGKSKSITVVHPNNITFGEDWRVSRSVILNYGMRGVFDNNWKFTSFIPVVTISCLMR